MLSVNTKKRLPGGHQVEFKDYPGSNLDKFEVDLDSLNRVKVLK